MARKSSPRAARDRATRYHSLIVRARGACQRCGRSNDLQCAHIIKRSRTATRTDLKNAWCLCSQCHWKVDNDAYEFWALVRKTISESGYVDLRDRAEHYTRSPGTFDWVAERDRLRELWKQTEALV